MLDLNFDDVFDEWDSLHRIYRVLPEESGDIDTAHSLLALGVLIRNGECEHYLKQIHQVAPRANEITIEAPVVIVAGFGRDQEAPDSMFETLQAALGGQVGTVISGGSQTGLPGMLGGIARGQDSCGCRGFKLIGYLPAAKLESHGCAGYDRLLTNENSVNFSEAEPIQMWIDLITSGVSPESVKLLGINGGVISAFEYRLALALGASVGLMVGSGRQADIILENYPKHPRLVPLPCDSATLWTFLKHETDFGFIQSENEARARAVHEVYRRTKQEKLIRAVSVERWEELDHDFRHSNYHQAFFAEEILRSLGFQVIAQSDDAEEASFCDEELLAMAEKEHGRWCIERLTKGWRYAPLRSDAEKKHPDLLPWSELSQSTKDYDIEAVRSWPKIFSEVDHMIIRR